jgi:16S rRNA processing protein RimM
MSDRPVDPDKIKNDFEGSSNSDEPVFILVGKVRKPHGLNGEILIEPFSDDPQRFKPGSKLLIGKDHVPFTIRARRSQDTAVLLLLKGIDTPEVAADYRNQMIYVDKKDLPQLPDGRYYHFDLIGLEVFHKDGKSLGKLTEVIETGANDVYVVVNAAGDETLLPAISQVILEVSLAEGRMTVDAPEWI